MVQYKKKSKILYVLKILSTKTDRYHPMTVNDIIEELGAYDIEAERKSVYRDIKIIREAGFNIVMHRAKEVGYYYDSYPLDINDLKMVLDAVQTSKFITKRKIKDLSKKIMSFTSQYNASELERCIFIPNRYKIEDEHIYTKVNMLQEAIKSKQKVRFSYLQPFMMDYECEIHEVLVSPYSICYNEDSFILVAGVAKHESGIQTYYVDKIINLNLLDEKSDDVATVTGDLEFNLSVYMDGLFRMQENDIEEVSLLIKREYFNIFYDRFKNIETKRSGAKTLYIKFYTNIDSKFLVWLLQFNDNVKVLSPLKLSSKIKTIAENITNLYSS